MTSLRFPFPIKNTPVGAVLLRLPKIYKFETIRPAPYETHDGEPAHIHYTIETQNYPEYWLTGLWFSDDPRVEAYMDKVDRDGGFSNITALSRDSNNILRGTRDIKLQKFKD